MEQPAETRAQRTLIPVGRMGIWWFLCSEVAVFGGLIASYLLFRLRHPEWATDASHTWFAVGAINTMVLLTSSLTMVLAHKAAGAKDNRRSALLVAATLALGLLFLVFKGVEYTHEIGHGLTPAAGLFWSFYYLMTGLHALHVTAGLVAMIAILPAVARGRRTARVEYVGLYWHFVDVIWIFLFPLLYLVG